MDGKRDIHIDGVAENVDLIFDELDYIDEDSIGIQLQVKNSSSE